MEDVDNVVNLSSTELSTNHMQLLGLGLNFALPHQKKHLLDFMTKLEYRKFTPQQMDYSFIYMNLEPIFENLKTSYSDYLPRRFRQALQELKNLKTVISCILKLLLNLILV